MDITEKACGHPLSIKWSVNAIVRKCSAGTRSKTQAEKKLNNVLALSRTGQYVGPKHERTMMTELAESSFRNYRIKKRKSLYAVELRWKKHLAPVFSSMRATDVTRSVLNRYVDERLAKGASSASINRELSALLRMLRLGQEEDKVSRVPKFPHLEENNIREGFLEDSQYPALAAECAKVGLWLRALFEFAYTYGWRRSELVNLRVRQCDLASRTIRLKPLSTKNKKTRVVSMSPAIYELVSASIMGQDKGPDDLVFEMG